MPTHGVPMIIKGCRFEVGTGPPLMFEVTMRVHAADQRGAVRPPRFLTDMGRQVADGDADPGLARLVGTGAVDKQNVVQRHLAGCQNHVRGVVVGRPDDLLAACQEVVLIRPIDVA